MSLVLIAVELRGRMGGHYRLMSRVLNPSLAWLHAKQLTLRHLSRNRIPMGSRFARQVPYSISGAQEAEAQSDELRIERSPVYNLRDGRGPLWPVR